MTRHPVFAWLALFALSLFWGCISIDRAAAQSQPPDPLRPYSLPQDRQTTPSIGPFTPRPGSEQNPRQGRSASQSPRTIDPNRPLIVTTIERPPFVIKTDQGLAGFSVELWQAIAADINRDFRFEPVAQFSNMLDRVKRREADAAIANITITSQREEVMDFTQPMFDAGLKVMVLETGTSVGLLGAIFNLEMLALIALSFLLLFGAANLMWWFEHRIQPYFQYPYREGVFRSFWWSLNVIVNGGFEERIPQTRWGRVFAVFLVFASLFIVSAFVAKITATLTVGELQSQIQSYSDLYGRKVGTTRGSTAAAFLQSHAIDYEGYDTIDDLFDAITQKRIAAVVHDAPVLEYFAATRGRNRVRVVGTLLRPEKYGIALAAGSPLLEDVNRSLLKLKENGDYARLLDRWFDRRN